MTGLLLRNVNLTFMDTRATSVHAPRIVNLGKAAPEFCGLTSILG